MRKFATALIFYTLLNGISSLAQKPSGRGWVALPAEKCEKAIKPLGQWNNLDVSVHGNHIVTQLDGVQIVDYTYSPAKFKDGHIALQIHAGQHDFRTRFKDLYIQALL
ncbi:MAG: 3-keto-disaccharide hydrolase [Terriglobia bacterium]